MLNVISPSNEFKKAVVDNIIDANAKDILFVLKREPKEVQDSTDDNPFLTKDYGSDFIDVQYSSVTKKGSVRWLRGNHKLYKPSGLYTDGDVEVVLPYEETLEFTLQRTSQVVVDNHTFSIKSYFPSGNPVNRFYVLLQERDVLLGNRM